MSLSVSTRSPWSERIRSKEIVSGISVWFCTINIICRAAVSIRFTLAVTVAYLPPALYSSHHLIISRQGCKRRKLSSPVMKAHAGMLSVGLPMGNIDDVGVYFPGIRFIVRLISLRHIVPLCTFFLAGMIIGRRAEKARGTKTLVLFYLEILGAEK